MKQRKKRVTLVILLSAALLSGWLFYLFGLDYILELMYRGELLSYLNEYAARWRSRQPNPSLKAFLEEGRAQLFRYGVLTTGLAIVSLALYALHPRRVEHFFEAETSPFNLALFRITVFGVLLTFDLERVHWYAGLPSSLQVAPPGLSSILPYVPTDAATVSVSTFVFQGACLFGLFGLFTRAAATTALVTGLYVLGLPQLYGKVGHYHHILWFTTLLIPSRSADVLSLDALRRAYSPHSSLTPEPDRHYALPIRWAWLLMGIIYFFPGFWKFVTEGLGWALSSNLKYEMHAKWFLRSITPPFRIDHFPLLYQGAGLLTLVFELGFVFTLPFRSLRSIGAGVALAFHQSTWLFMGIAFLSLQPFVVFLLDVRRGLAWMGRRLTPAPLTVFYHPDESWQRRTAQALTRMDLCDRLRIQAAPTRPSAPASPCLSVSSASSDRRALWIDGNFQLSSALHLTRFVPMAAVLLPLAPIAQRPSEPVPASSPSTSTSAIMTVGSVLLAVNVFCGFGQISSYPVSVYPTFAGITDSTRTTLRVKGTTASGRVVNVLDGAQNNEQIAFAADRFRGLLNSILRTDNPEAQRIKLRNLWTILRTERRAFQSITSLRFYRATYSTNPDRSSPLLSTSLIAQLDTLNTSSLSSRSD